MEVVPTDYQARRKLQGEQTEHNILEASLALMQERGFDHVSIRDICQKAGITTGAFYHHFSSKEDLLTKGFTPMDRYVEEALRAHEDDTPAQRLDRILTAYATFIQEESGELTGRYYQRRLGAPDSQSMDSGHFIHKAMLDCFDHALADGLVAPDHSAQWMADFCYRHFRGVVIDWVLHGYRYPLLPKMKEDYVFFEQMFLAAPPEDDTYRGAGGMPPAPIR